MNTRTAHALKSKDDFNMDGVRTQDLADTAEAIRRLFRAEPPKTANRWAAQMSEIRKACSGLTEEEFRLHECRAMSSWECR